MLGPTGGVGEELDPPPPQARKKAKVQVARRARSDVVRFMDCSVGRGVVAWVLGVAAKGLIIRSGLPRPHSAGHWRAGPPGTRWRRRCRRHRRRSGWVRGRGWAKGPWPT